MKKLVKTIQHIWSIKELRERIIYTLALLFLFRIGTFVTLPGVDPLALENIRASQTGDPGLLDLLNSFAGGAFYRAGIFALGIMPYISASIVMQLLTLVVPSVKKIQNDGESGRRKINQYTRALTVLITLVQAVAYIAFLRTSFSGALVITGSLFSMSTVIILIAGTLFVMWLGERITDKGIGNGVSLLITVGIIASLPAALMGEINAKFTSGAGGALVFLIEIIVWFLIVMATIAIVQATRKIPVQYPKRMVGRGGRMAEVGGARQFIPLKLNASGVMPIIFAQALLFLPATIAQNFAGSTSGFATFMTDLTDVRSPWYNILTFVLVIVFTYFYTALIINPKEISENMKQQGGFIPGVRPGKQTTTFIENILDRITLPGSIFLGIIAILPAFAQIFGVGNTFAMFFGGTSLLIMISVVLDTLQQIESYLLMRHYDGLLESGNMQSSRSKVGASF